MNNIFLAFHLERIKVGYLPDTVTVQVENAVVNFFIHLVEQQDQIVI